MEIEEQRTAGGGLSRRALVRSIAAGAAVTWSAPTVLSAGAQASAGSPGPVAPCEGFPDDVACANGGLNDLQGCNGDPPEICFSSCNQFGDVVCARRQECNATDCGPSGSNGVCGDGNVCARTCCPEFGGLARFQCFPPCR
jgi:hypothetical protein